MNSKATGRKNGSAASKKSGTPKPSKTAAKTPAKPSPKAPEKTGEKGKIQESTGKTSPGVIETFDKVPAPASNRSTGSSYDFASVEPGKALVLAVTGSTPEEKKNSANRHRSNLFAAFYRFLVTTPAAKSWKRAIRIVNGSDGLPEKVGFYRTE